MASVTFSQTTYAAGTRSSSVAVGDLNGDGIPDLAVSDDYALGSGFSVLFGTGSGGFSSPNRYSLKVGTGDSIAIGDLNSDGKPDLTVAVGAETYVLTLLNDGSGRFISPTTYPAGTYPSSVAIADLNGDGKSDLVVGNGIDNTISVLLNNGSGGFNPQTIYKGGSTPVIADFNGDGKPDLATESRGSNTVSVLLGTGAGDFIPQTTYSVVNPVAVVAGDFNGDGKPDLAVSRIDGGGKVSILLNNGSGGFTNTQTSYAVGSTPNSIATGDLNGDGKLDLVTGNDSDHTVSVLLGNGRGGFSPQTAYAVEGDPSSVAISDLNGDGKLDLAVANRSSGTVSVLLNTIVKPDVLTGMGKETLVGTSSVDYFTFQTPTASTLRATTRIENFDQPGGDRLVLGFIPKALYNIGKVNADSLVSAAKTAYQDKNKKKSGNQLLKRNEAVLFNYKGSTYLSVDNGKNGLFSPKQDLLVNLSNPLLGTGGGKPAVLSVNSYFS
jgi:hypothetical protein